MIDHSNRLTDNHLEILFIFFVSFSEKIQEFLIQSRDLFVIFIRIAIIMIDVLEDNQKKAILIEKIIDHFGFTSPLINKHFEQMEI